LRWKLNIQKKQTAKTKYEWRLRASHCLAQRFEIETEKEMLLVVAL
jgi:hypothetical protein